MFSVKLGLDLGTANTIVFVEGKGIALKEPTVVAVRVEDYKVVAVGQEAKEMIGKTPQGIVAKRPLRSGVIANSQVTEALLKYFFMKALGGVRFIKPDVVISVSAGITSVERRAVIKAAKSAGAKNIELVPEPLLAAMGAGLPIDTSSGNMIINIGGGTAEIAVLSLGGVVAFESLRVAGDAINDTIISYLRKEHGLLIGEQTAEQIKIKIGSAIPIDEPQKLEIRGRDFVSGMPRSLIIDSNLVAEAVKDPLLQIVSAVKRVLANTPPELSADIMDRGMVMTGGSSKLRNLDKLFTMAIGVPAHVADEPLYCVAKGTGKLLGVDNIENELSR